MILELSNIYKTYQQDALEVPVLKDVSLSVDKGDYLAIQGPSGSGKSTLMNIIGCLDLPTEGTYQLNGTDVLAQSDNSLSEIRCREIGFVFQSYQLLPGETALHNVMLPLSFAGVPRSKRKAIAEEALRRVGLGERMNFMPNQLSGGQKQRVAIARALVNDPNILLADEPTGALDQKSGAQVMELFKKLNEEGVTIVMITHDSGIAAHAKKIKYIVDGRIYDREEDARHAILEEEQSAEAAESTESKEA
ncbi:MAG: ABC transporter ATP-binding protein [Lachnospiraceae bacterium]|nr:ABC transporter ATP-binding protein [Lachnospiraceae bacterium]